MARFVFKLQAVLRQRELLEQERQRDLAAVQSQMASLKEQLRQLDEQVQATNHDMRANHLTGRLDMSFLAAHRRYMAAAQRQAMNLAQRMAQVQRQIEQAQAALAEAAKGRKVMEKLRERQHQRWREEMDRKETAALDEVAMQMSRSL